MWAANVLHTIETPHIRAAIWSNPRPSARSAFVESSAARFSHRNTRKVSNPRTGLLSPDTTRSAAEMSKLTHLFTLYGMVGIVANNLREVAAR